ncbi:MAG TPA: hypothetical protein VK714_05110 [Myxococcota bacterium]|nr:hypothetical protein [Myxococcota bacterium]
MDDREEFEEVHQGPIEEIFHDPRGLLRRRARPMVLVAVRGLVVTADLTAVKPTQFVDQAILPTVGNPKPKQVPPLERATGWTPGSLDAELRKSSTPRGAP